MMVVEQLASRADHELPHSLQQMHGRDFELRQSLTLLSECAQNGLGRGCVIEGEPGAGKTELLRILAAAARDRGMRVVALAGDELEQHTPFGALGAAFDIAPARQSPITDYAPRASISGNSDLSGLHGARPVGELVSAQLAHWLAEQPVAIIVDDLQWFDGSSLAVLHHLSRLLHEAPLFLAAVYRPAPKTEDLARILRSLVKRGATHIVLEPLDDSAVHSLTEQTIGATPGTNLIRMTAAAGGNPRYLLDLLAKLKRERAIRVTDTAAEILDIDLVRSTSYLDDGSLCSLDFLSDQSQELLTIAAALGPEFSIADLAALAQYSVPTFLRALREATDLRVLAGSGDRYSFRHEMVRRALIARAPGALCITSSGWPRRESHLGNNPGSDVSRSTLDVHAHELGVGPSPDGWRSGNLHCAKAWSRFIDGRWDDCLEQARAGLESAADRTVVEDIRGVAALVSVHRGLVTTLRLESKKVTNRQLHWALALELEASGKVHDALTTLLALSEQEPATASDKPIYYLYPDIARLAVVVGDLRTASKVASEMDRLSRGSHEIGVRSIAQLCHGLLNSDADALLTAAADFAQAGRPLYEGYARENAAAVLATAGRLEQARTVLDAAVGIYDTLGANMDSARAKASLRMRGIRRGVRGPRRRPKIGWDALTETERTVAELVATGLSNPGIGARLFLSPRTVQTHVSSILHKLGLASRVEVAVEVAKQSAQTSRSQLAA